jgi:hypothetical protein
VIGQCALCDAKETNLRESHSIPKFVFQWLKDTSKTPYIRSSDDVNIRHQDGPKEYLLCGTCEGDLAVLEKELAEQLFRKVANYRQQRSLISVTEAMRVAVLSIFWRALLTTKHRDSDRTAEDKHSLDLFLDSIKAEIRLGRCNTKIYIAPFYGSPPYYGFPKAMTYKLERSIGSQDIRFFDDPHRFFAAFKLPFMYFYIFGDGWTEKDLKNSTELIVGQLMVDEIKEIPSMLRSYIEYQYREYLKSLTQMDEKNLDQVKADAAKNKNITGSDKSKSRSDS